MNAKDFTRGCFTCRSKLPPSFSTRGVALQACTAWVTRNSGIRLSTTIACGKRSATARHSLLNKATLATAAIYHWPGSSFLASRICSSSKGARRVCWLPRASTGTALRIYGAACGVVWGGLSMEWARPGARPRFGGGCPGARPLEQAYATYFASLQMKRRGQLLPEAILYSVKRLRAAAVVCRAPGMEERRMAWLL